MKQFGAFEAKTHFSEILAAVILGEKFIICKHGVQVALLIPYKQEDSIDPVADAIRSLKKLRKGIHLGEGLTIRKMREEGRR